MNLIPASLAVGSYGTSGPPPAIESVTGPHGGFQFESIQPGAYILRCVGEGLFPFERALDIGSSAHADIVVTLRRRAGDEISDEPPLERLRRLRDAGTAGAGPAASTPLSAVPSTPSGAVPATPSSTPLSTSSTAPPSTASEQRAGSTDHPPGAEALPFPDRWSFPLPDWDRYPGRGILDNPFRKSGLLDPYDQNELKGDFPAIGQNTFLNLTAAAETAFEMRRVPTPSGQSAALSGPDKFFGDPDQRAGTESVLLSLEMFRGNAAFRPVDWRFKLTAGLSFNYLAVRERGVVNIDVREGTDRTDQHAAAQELFGEVKLADIGPSYDFVSVRAGIQSFVSDFRGFLFVENQPGVRLFGSFGANRWQWNVAAFELLEKDTNSGLNTTHRRHQQVGIANLYLQDFLVPGYTLQGSIHFSDDRAGSRDREGGFHFDDNGFLVRPAAIGDFTPHDLRIVYAGLTGDGHIGRLNVTDALYLARGHDDHNPIAGRSVRVRATMAAVEASIDRDWLRYRASAFYASGDEDPVDRVATGFDAIVDNPAFAGAGASFWNRQGIRLTGTNVGLVGRFSILPDLRSSKEEGQANFVNPGLFLYNIGADADLTPKLRLTSNLNYVRFDTTEVLENILFQDGIRRPLGFDGSLGVTWRPTLIDNLIVSGGLAVFRPASGFRDIYGSTTLFSAFAALTLTY